MRGYPVLALAVAVVASSVVGLGTAAGAPASSHTALTVKYWENGPQRSEPVVWTLRCDPARGTHPRTAASCRRLADVGRRVFRAYAKNVACTEIYGGPQVARVTGLVDGERVWANLSRTDGCAIARWNRLVPWLLPPGGVT